MNEEDKIDINISWDVSNSLFLNSKNAVHGQIATIESAVREVPSRFNKDAKGNPKKDLVVDLKMDDGTIKTLRLNLASQKNFQAAGIEPKDVIGIKVKINVIPVLVRGELAKSVCLEVVK